MNVNTSDFRFPNTVRDWLKQFVVVLFYLLLNLLLSDYFIVHSNTTATFSSASGLALAVLLIGGSRYILAIILGSLLFHGSHNDSVTEILIVTVANVFESLFAVWLLTHKKQFSLTLNTIADLLRLIGWSSLACFVANILGGFALHFTSTITADGFFHRVWYWWAADMLGVVLVTPLVLICWTEGFKSITRVCWLKSLFLLSVTFLAGQLIFFNLWHENNLIFAPKGFQMFFFITWIAIQLDRRFTMLALNMIAIQVFLSVHQKVGYFTNAAIDKCLIPEHWLYLVILFLVGMVISTHTRETKSILNKLHQSSTLFRTVYNSTSNAMMMLDTKGFFDCNQATLELFGCPTREEFCSYHPADISPAEQPCGTNSLILANQRIAAALAKGHIRFEWMHKRMDTGDVFPAEVLLTSMTLDGRTVLNATVVDITERKAAEAEIKLLAFYDELTELPNRRLLLERLSHALASSHRNNKKGALFFIDMDNFKNLNDTLGHDMGDLLLQQVAQRLTASVREDDTVARLGGDEFVVMLEGLNESSLDVMTEVELVGNKILVALNENYQLGAYNYHSTPSIGATLFNGYEKDISEVIKQADEAMYQAKSQGKNALRFYTTDG